MLLTVWALLNFSQTLHWPAVPIKWQECRGAGPLPPHFWRLSWAVRAEPSRGGRDTHRAVRRRDGASEVFWVLRLCLPPVLTFCVLWIHKTPHKLPANWWSRIVFQPGPFFSLLNAVFYEPVSHCQVGADWSSQARGAVAGISHLEVRLCFYASRSQWRNYKVVVFYMQKGIAFSIQAHLIHTVQMPKFWILLIYHSNAILHLDCVSLLKGTRVAHKKRTHFNNTSWKHSLLWGGEQTQAKLSA